MLLLDTDVAVDILRDHPHAIHWLQALGIAPLGFAGWVVMELLQGCQNKSKEFCMVYNVRLENITPNSPTAVVRRRAPAQDLAKVVPAACGIVWGVVRAKQIQGAGRHIALYLDGQINLEVGVELQAPFAGHGEVIGSALPSGPVATTVHFGPYNQLHAAHQAIRNWCTNHGHALAGPNWEIYGHWMNEWSNDPAKIRTDVFYLLKAGGGPAG